MSEYRWNKKNNTFTWLSSFYNPFENWDKVFCKIISLNSKKNNRKQTFFVFFIENLSKNSCIEKNVIMILKAIRPLLLESSVIVIFYLIFLMRYAVITDYHFGKKILIKRKQGVNNCFKPLISSDFTIAASRLRSEQNEKEK